MRYLPSEKISIINEVLKDKQSVYGVCKEHNISKATFYKWLAVYKRVKKNRLLGLECKVRKGSSHPKSLSYAQKTQILGFVHKNPEYSCRQVANALNFGHHAVQNLLEKEYLNRLDQRQSYAEQPFWKRESAERRLGMMELYNQGWKVNEVCRHYKISKPTFNKWRKRFEQADEQHQEDALRDSYIQGSDHHRWLGDRVRNLVVDAVKANPEYSAHKLHVHLNNEEALRLRSGSTTSGLRSGSTIGHHAVQNILERENLNTFEKRQVFAGGYLPEPKVAVAKLYEVPVMKLSLWRMLFAPFVTIPKWIIRHPVSWPIVLPSILFLAYIFEVDKAFKPTVLFPLVALTFGFFFFLYSMKYYISLIIVMRVSQKGTADGEQKKRGRIVSFLEKRFNLGSAQVSRADPLLLNLEKVELARQPFVSVHLAIFNEKRVVARLIEACQNQQWNNYEIILADDSTDETTDIIKEILAADGRTINKNFIDDNLEIFVSTPPASSALPVIKLIHRFSRSGYKGAALQKALENTDARAEYISVFDSDFVPYPDTISQFVKMFQESCGGLDNVTNTNIAAVQGYQWHVLNKSQNWVTRGVRSEYAGSYVIERAGIGIYGGLNMIAGSVFCIRADLLRAFAWGKSITEDFELTLRLYERGYKVVFTPHIQAPAEAVSTVRRLIRQRMRWAEGHTFNIRKMAGRILMSPYVNRREKGEFVYLAPYYLQAAFFMIGTLAWFLSEVVLKVRLPFWTAAWGWSLVFVNFLALPLMNLVGLFLEESEEKDYLGIVSFLVLSYIVVPFQAYAAVKALFEESEGPWFRTPKTGNITDAFDRVSFYKFFEKFKSLGKDKSSPAPAFSPVVVGSSSYNRFSGYNIRVKRSSFVSRSALAVLLLSVMFVNYLAFFVPQTEAHHSGIHLEQQVEVIGGYNQVVPRTTTSTTATPTDSSLGSFYYESSKYSATALFYFEAVIAASSGATTTAKLYTEGGTEVTGSAVTTTNTAFNRQRSAAITLTNATAYTVRYYTSGGTATIKNGRVIITQNPGTGKITDTRTMVQVGSAFSTTSTTYTDIFANRYCYSTNGSSANCTGANTGVWTPAPTFSFQASLQVGTFGDTVYAELFDGTNPVAETSSTGIGGYTVQRDTTVTLTAAKSYYVRLKCVGTCSTPAYLASAQIVMDQTDGSGISNLETIQHYLVGNDILTSGGYTDKVFPNQYTPANLTSASKVAYFEAEIYQGTCGGGGKGATACGTVYAVLYNETDAVTINTGSPPTSEVSTTSQTRTILRSQNISGDLPTSNKDLSFELKTTGAQVIAINAWLVVQISSLQVPEVALVAAPLMLFIPKMAKKIGVWWRKRKKEKALGTRH